MSPSRYGSWRPENYGGGYRGSISVQEALQHSVNTVAVQLAAETGRQKVGRLARRFGLASIPERPALSVALGAYEVSLLELTGAYQVFQRGGRAARPYLIERITTARGDLLYARASSAPIRVYDAPLNTLMVAMMKRVIQAGTGQRGDIGRPAAAKTGTSQDWRDAWFVGFTPDWAAGVWVGNDNNWSMNRVVGGDLPAQIWRRFMLHAHRGLPPRDFPALAPAEQAREAGLVDARAGFYSTLAAEFAREAGGGGAPPPPAQDRVEDAPPEEGY